MRNRDNFGDVDIHIIFLSKVSNNTSYEVLPLENLENNMKHDIQTMIIFKEDYEYPHPYGEYRWKQLGGWQQLIST